MKDKFKFMFKEFNSETIEKIIILYIDLYIFTENEEAMFEAIGLIDAYYEYSRIDE